jgi:GNAT superfamily N-acetyltransferase
MHYEQHRGEYTVSTDPGRLDFSVIHGYLTTSYWSPGVQMEVVRKAAAHSLAFGLYRGDAQIGYARVVTDLATFAYLADVFVLEAHRGAGLGTWLIEIILAHPDLQGLRRFMLATRDAHALYRKFGFTELSNPARFMERWNPNVYRQGGGGETGAS